MLDILKYNIEIISECFKLDKDLFKNYYNSRKKSVEFGKRYFKNCNHGSNDINIIYL